MHSPAPTTADDQQMGLFVSVSPEPTVSPTRATEYRGERRRKVLNATETRTLAPRALQLGLEMPRGRMRRPQPLNDYEWDDQELHAFREGVLFCRLRLLADQRASLEEREDVLDWITEPKKTPEELKFFPVSFQACCLAVPVNFEEMRDLTLEHFAPERLSALK